MIWLLIWVVRCARSKKQELAEVRMRVDGSEVFLGQEGSAAADNAILLLHGAGMDHSVWTMPARSFRRHGYRVIVPDLPAHGRSAGPALQSIDAMAAWAWRLLDQLSVRDAVVFGHSMGSLIASTMAALAPSRVLALGLLGTSQPMPVAAPLLRAAQDNHAAAFDMANTWSHSHRGQLGGSAMPGVWLLGTGRSLLQRNAPGVYAADLSACNAFEPLSVETPLSTPTLVVVGEADRMTPVPAGLAVAGRFADCTVTRLPGSGHALLSERPNEVLDAMARLVERALPRT